MDRKAGFMHGHSLDRADDTKNSAMLDMENAFGIVISVTSFEDCNIKTGDCKIFLVKQRVQ